MPLLAKVPDEHGSEVWIALGREHAEAVAERPEDEPGDPLLQAEAERCRQRASAALPIV